MQGKKLAAHSSQPGGPSLKGPADMYHRQDLQNIDIVTGGFPCPDIAIAGKKRGFSGKRSVLFKHVVKVAVLSKASFVFFFLENVANILSRDMQPVFADVPKVMLQKI